MPGRRALATPGQEGWRRRSSRGEGNHLPGQGLILQGVRAEIEMHLQQAGAPPQARSLRRIPGSRAQLRWNALIREGPEKAQGVDRTAVCRGQGLARPQEVSP